MEPAGGKGNNDQREHESSRARNNAAAKIGQLAGEVTHRICTGQVVISLAGACRELIDNALDAGATSIEIRTKENGAEFLEVIDNGCGIAEENFDLLCKPHSTSKLSAIDDFNFLSTFGFRGEALNALAALSEITITTRHASSKIASRLRFDRNGALLARDICPRQIGTTVCVANLFGTLPVRRQEFVRNARREFVKMLATIQSFALSRIDCRFNCSNLTNGKRIQMLSTPGNCTQLKEVISSLFGVVRVDRGASVLTIVEALPDADTMTLYGVKLDPTLGESVFHEIKLSGYVSSIEFSCGRNSSDRQFIYVNKRPVDFAKLNRIVNEVYNHFNRGQYCMLVLFVDVDSSKLDVNVSPDKRTVFLQNEKELFAKLRASLWHTFTLVNGNCPRDTVALSATSQTLDGSQLGLRSSRSTTQLEFLTQMSTDAIMPNFIADGIDDSICDNSANNTPANMSASGCFDLRDNEDNDDFFVENFGRNLFTNKASKHKTTDRNTNDGGDFAEMDLDIPYSLNEADHFAVNESYCTDISEQTKVLQAPQENDVNDDNDDEISFVEHHSQKLTSSLVGRPSVSATPFLIGSKGPPADSEANDAINSPTYDEFRASMRRTLEAYAFRPTGGGNSGACNNDAPRTSTPLSAQTNERVNATAICHATQPAFISAAALFRKKQQQSSHENDGIGPNGDAFDASQHSIMAASNLSKFSTNDENDNMNDGNNNMNVQEALNINNTVEHSTIGNPLNDEPSANSERNESAESREWTLDSQTAFANKSSTSNHSCIEAFVRTEQMLEIPNIEGIRKAILQRKRTHRREIADKNPIGNCGELACVIDEQLTQIASTPSSALNEVEEKNRDEERLNLMLKKTDFARMFVIGQFNNAFILTRLDDDLFMIDQHASDEKYNFERFKRRAQIATQTLINEKPLELSAVEECVLRDNIDIFRANGFDFIFNDQNAKFGQRVLLKSVPVLHGWNFDISDIEEIVGVLRDFPGVMYRPAKLRKIFASRACRRSAMFGTALTRQQMEQIVRNMGTMEQPWNCPHGRPTIRHLCTIKTGH